MYLIGDVVKYFLVQVKEQLPPEFFQMLAESELEKSTGTHPIAMVVIRDGETLNIFRLIDSNMSLETIR